MGLPSNQDDEQRETFAAPPVPRNKPVKRTSYKYDLVEVRWDDAHGDAGWQDISKKPLEPMIAISIGFLVKDEPEYILIADSYFENEPTYIGGTNQVPRGMVKSITVLRAKGKT